MSIASYMYTCVETTCIPVCLILEANLKEYIIRTGAVGNLLDYLSYCYPDINFICMTTGTMPLVKA